MTDGWTVVYIYFITAARNSISSQLGSSCQGNRYQCRKGRQQGLSIIYKITPAGSLSPSQPGGQPCRASPLAFSLIEPTYTVTRIPNIYSQNHNSATSLPNTKFIFQKQIFIILCQYAVSKCLFIVKGETVITVC